MTDRIRVLVVEDHPIMTYMLGRILERAPDCELVAVVASGQEALDVLAAGEVDLVTTDLNLPGMDGVELVAEIRRLRPALPVVVVTAHEDASYLRRATAAGASECLGKRTIGQTLLPAIRRLAGGG